MCSLRDEGTVLSYICLTILADLFPQMESVVSSPVSGKVKRVLVKENDSIAQGDLTVEITH